MLLHEARFRPRELTADGYAELAAHVAPSVAEMPGLILKIWTGRDADGRFAGIYLWRDRASYEAFAGGPFDVAASADFVDVETRQVEVLEAPTTITAHTGAALSR